MAGTQPESRLVQAIRDRLAARLPGCVILRMHGSPFQPSGIPDLLVFFDGRVWGVEVKRRSGAESSEQARQRATPLQRAMIARLRATGIRADVVTSPEEAWDMVAHGRKFLEVGGNQSHETPV